MPGAPASDGLKSFAVTFALTLTNPMTVLAFLAIFSTIGIDAGISAQPAWLVLGVFLGSVLWWLLLSSLASGIRRHLANRHLLWINRLSAVILIGFAALAVLAYLESGV